LLARRTEFRWKKNLNAIPPPPWAWAEHFQRFSHFIFFAVVYPFESQLLFLDIFNCSSIVMRGGGKVARSSEAPPKVH
jgi:hypothetical protein